MKQSSTTLRSIRIVSGIAILIVITVFLAACSSIPLGTMWKMRGMGLEDLAGTNPEEVRAAVMSESWFLDSPNFDSGRLKIEMRRADNSVEAFSFILADTSERGHYGLEAAGGRWRWRIYQIEPAQLELFQAMQRQLAEWLESEEFAGGGMAVAVQFSGDDAGHRGDVVEQAGPGNDPVERPVSIRFRIDLRLSEEDGFFPLLRDHDMPISHTDDAS